MYQSLCEENLVTMPVWKISAEKNFLTIMHNAFRILHLAREIVASWVNAKF